MLRIAHLIDAQGGGALTYVITLAREIAREDASVEIIFFIPGPVERLARELGIKTVVISKKMPLDPTLIWRISGYLKKNKIDIKHTHTLNGNFYGRLAATLAGIPVVTTMHGYMDELSAQNLNTRTRLFCRIDRLMWGMSSRFIAVTPGIGERLRQQGLAPDRVEVISNAIDLPRPGLQAGPDIRRELGIRPSSTVVSIVGRLVPVKNHDLFIRAAKAALEKFPDTQFLIIGDGPLAGKLKALSDELGIGESVIFAGWRNDMEQIYMVTDILVLCSLSEGLPFAILEAMSHGKSVIATDIKEIGEVVINGSTGMLVPPGDVDALAGAIVRLIEDPLSRKRLGSGAKAFIEKDFSVKTMVSRVLSLYRGMAV